MGETESLKEEKIKSDDEVRIHSCNTNFFKPKFSFHYRCYIGLSCRYKG